MVIEVEAEAEAEAEAEGDEVESGFKHSVVNRPGSRL